MHLVYLNSRELSISTFSSFMDHAPTSNLLSKWQRILFLLVCIFLATGLFILRAGLDSRSSLDTLARKSLDPYIAISNGRPTVYEFYADWCQACKEMAPTMLKLEAQNRDKIDFIFLNVDNPRWVDLISSFNVNGVPQLNFFDANGEVIATSLGLKNENQLKGLLTSLITGERVINSSVLKESTNFSDLNSLNKENPLNTNKISPRSHSY